MTTVMGTHWLITLINTHQLIITVQSANMSVIILHLQPKENKDLIVQVAKLSDKVTVSRTVICTDW